MLVLFTGNRGAGKSTIAREVCRELDSRGVRYQHQSSWRARNKTFLGKIGYALYFWRFFDRRMFAMYGGYLLRHPARALRSYSIYLPLIFGYHLNLLQQKNVEVVLYDSDVFHVAVAAVRGGYFDPKKLQNLYSSVVVPKVEKVLIVLVDTNPAESVERWRERDGTTLTEVERAKWVAERTAWRTAIREVVDALDDVSGVSVIRLNGSLEPGHNAEEVLRHIQG